MPSATQPGVFYMSTNNTTREEGVKVLYCAKSTNKFRTQRCISGNLGQTLHPLYFTASCWGWIQELVGKHKAWKYKQNGLFGTWYPLLGANFYWLYWHTHIHHTTFCKYYYYGSQLQGQFYIQMASSSRSTPIWKRGEGPPSGGERALLYNSQGMGLFFPPLPTRNPQEFPSWAESVEKSSKHPKFEKWEWDCSGEFGDTVGHHPKCQKYGCILEPKTLASSLRNHLDGGENSIVVMVVAD